MVFLATSYKMVSLKGNQVIGATTFRKNGVIAAESGRSEWTKTPNSATANLNSKERRVEDGKRIQFLADLHKNEQQEKELAKAKRFKLNFSSELYFT